jgi:lipid-A-disaccharide synthase
VSDPIDILILSNGPGELSTWVQPVVRELRRQLGDDRSQVRISVVLAPCANASGQEVAIARRFPEVDRIQGADHFLPFLLTGKTKDDWDWRARGVVLFLGGDQFFPIMIGKRLGYRIVIYAEWAARWHRWGDRFGVMNDQVLQHVSPQYASKFAVVGDLMAEADAANGQSVSGLASLTPPMIGLLPGSKPMKLTLGVPLTLAIADHIQPQRPDVQFVIPVAPTLDADALASYADPLQNPIIERLGWASGTLKVPTDIQALPYLQTAIGTKVSLWKGFPAYDVLAQCELCLTTLGANTAELGALGVPMLILLPTQQLDIMKAWDGIPGLLVNLPGVGSALATLINWIAAQKPSLRAWPNIWAKREIVPELLGKLEPEAIAAKVLHYLDNPDLLDQMRQDLRQVRGTPGAATKLVQLVQEELGRSPISPP